MTWMRRWSSSLTMIETLSLAPMATPRGPSAAGQLARDELALDQELAVEGVQGVDVLIGQLEAPAPSRELRTAALDVGALDCGWRG